jgi:hypothetical protein
MSFTSRSKPIFFYHNRRKSNLHLIHIPRNKSQLVHHPSEKLLIPAPINYNQQPIQQQQQNQPIPQQQIPHQQYRRI